MRMIISAENRSLDMIGNRTTTIWGVYIERSGVSCYGVAGSPDVRPATFEQFADVLERARQLVLEMERPVYRVERSVSILGELPTRVAEFYRNADKLPYRCEPGRSRLAQLLTAYLTGQDIPLAAIWDYIQEFVLTA